VFEEIAGFGETFAFESEGGLVFLRARSMLSPAKASSWADGQEFRFDGGSDAEGRPWGDIVHLLPHKRSQELRTSGSTDLYQKNAQMRRREAMTSSV
jgi:hypothetical protein